MSDEQTEARDRSGLKGVVVRLQAELAVLPSRHVRGVFLCGPVTQVPTTPVWLLGLVNHRSRVLPLIALERLLAELQGRSSGSFEPMPRSEAGTVVPWVASGDREAALLVSAVGDVVTLPSPDFGAEPVAIGDLNGEPVRVIDLPAVLEQVRDHLWTRVGPPLP